MNIETLKKRNEVKVTESPIEEKLLKWFRKYGLDATPQYEIPPYRVDFAFEKIKLVVECDGLAFHSSDDQQVRDKNRDRYLRSRGWKVLRYWGSEINSEPWEILKEILARFYGRGSWKSEDEKYQEFLEKKNVAWNKALEIAEEEKLSDLKGGVLKTMPHG